MTAKTKINFQFFQHICLAFIYRYIYILYIVFLQSTRVNVIVYVGTLHILQQERYFENKQKSGSEKKI